MLAQIHSHLAELLLTLLQPCLDGVVHDRKLVAGARPLFIGFRGQLLPFAYIVNFVRHGTENTDGTRPVQPHVVEHLHHGLWVLAAQAVCQSEDGLVRILLQQPCKFLHTHAGYTRKLLRVRLHLREHITEGRAGHFVTQQVLVHNSTKAHYLCLRQPHLFPEPSDACREVHQIPCVRGGVLRQLIDGRTRGQHCSTQPFFLVLTEGHGQLANLVYRAFPKVIAQRHIDGIGRFDKLQDAVLRSNTQSSGGTCQLVQFLPTGARVHFLQFLVQVFHLFRRQPRIFSDVGHLLLHICVALYGLACRHGNSRNRSEYLRDSPPVCIQEADKLPPYRLLCTNLLARLLQFAP